MNMYDKKEREEVGFHDMHKYDFGGVEIEEKLSNGCLVYIPYGIYVDFFKAMEQSILSMVRQKDSLKGMLEISENERLNDQLKLQIKDLEKHIEMFERILPLVNEV